MEAAQAGLPLALPGPRERHGKLAFKCLPWMWSLTRRLVHLWQFPRSPLGMQAAGGIWFKGQAGQEEAREVWEVAACHVGKQAPVRDGGAWGWAGGAGPSIANGVPGLSYPEKALALLGATKGTSGSESSVALHRCWPCLCPRSEGTRQAGWAREEVMPGARPSRLALEKPPSKSGAAAGSQALGARQSAARLLCGHRGVCDTSSLGCFLVTGQLPAVPPLRHSRCCSWPRACFAHCLLRVMAAIQRLPGFRERER